MIAGTAVTMTSTSVRLRGSLASRAMSISAGSIRAAIRDSIRTAAPQIAGQARADFEIGGRRLLATGTEADFEATVRSDLHHGR
jgi:hypothetical protein